ncbi:MAG: glycosyltransferase family 4 protein [Bacteroidetes bacterium]|nr:glycosyltransferase family 4 protein [Bacteroidota bacterium]
MDYAPSQRFRFEQYFELLKKNGVEIEARPFIDVATWNSLYLEGNFISKTIGIGLGFIKRFRDVFRAKEADLIFIHREAAPMGLPFLEWIISNVLGKKIIYDFDDAIWLPNTSKENALVARIKWHSKVGSICRWSWKLSCGNNFLTDFARIFNTNVLLNPTTIDTNYHDPNKQRKKERPLTIGWTGSHSTLKYIEFLVPIIARLEKEIDFRFLVISNQAPKFHLESLEYRKWDKATEIKDLMEIDIGLMPLTDDPWAKGKCGFKALQYMALEIPALISPVGVNGEIVEDGKEGFHCTTTEDWYLSITNLIQDVDLRTQLGSAGRKKVIARYSVESNGENFMSLFTH